MFFLQNDSGRLRTICDNFAFNCVLPVFSGSHETFRPGANVAGAITDVLLTRGKGADDAQMLKALNSSTFGAFNFAPEATITKLEELIFTEGLPVRQAACESLRVFSRSAPYDNPDFRAVLAKNPAFSKALSVCSTEKNNR